MAKSRRTPEQNVVPGVKIPISKNNPEYKYLKNSKRIIVLEDNLQQDASLVSTIPFPQSSLDLFLKDIKEKEENLLDKVELTDIESITVEKYYDPSTKEQRGRAIIKIRNNSTTPETVVGVDARIYNPNVS